MFDEHAALSFDSGNFILWRHQYLNIGFGDDAAERDSVTPGGQLEGKFCKKRQALKDEKRTKRYK